MEEEGDGGGAVLMLQPTPGRASSCSGRHFFSLIITCLHPLLGHGSKAFALVQIGKSPVSEVKSRF